MSRSIGIEIPEDETLDALRHGKLKVLQKKQGYRFSLDALLIADFFQVHRLRRIADLGCGSGVIPLLLAQKSSGLSMIGIEVQERLVDLAIRNVSLNALEERISIICLDIRNVKQKFSPGEFDGIVMNPPYLPLEVGHINPDAERAIAKHEMLGTLEDFIQAARYLLTSHGRMACIYPAKRLVDLLARLHTARLEPKRLRLVYPRLNEPACLALVEAVRGAKCGLDLLPPLLLYQSCGSYTEEMEKIFAFDA